MQKGNKQIENAGLQLIAISYDDAESLKEFAAKQKIKYPLLSDNKSEVIKQFDMLNKSVKKGTSKYGISHPRTLVIDQSGTVLSSLSSTVTKRHDVEKLLESWAKVKEKASEGPFKNASKKSDED